MIFCSLVLADTGDHINNVQKFLAEFWASEKGQWLYYHCPNLSHTVVSDPEYWGYKVVISGELSPEDETYFTLKYK